MGVKDHFTRRKWLLKRFFPGVLACILLLSAAGVPALAVNGTASATSRAIAIVFDNSGSMYVSQNKAWCRATYAIEVFASMMNEGDTLQVYPMYEVTIGGKSYTSQNPFSISGGGDTSVIRSMYTPSAENTPIETIGDAYNGLRKTSADEKWLIVLTDGDEFFENGNGLGAGDKTAARLSEKLTEYNQDVNVLYLGIGSKAVIPEVSGGGTYQYHTAKASDSADTLTKLTEMCNLIFGRDVLDSAGSQLTFDVSMKKLILFVQGKDISGVTLKNSSGASVGSPSLEYSPRYGEQGAGTVRADGAPLSFSVDDSLSGYIAIYDTELDAGTYSLSYSGDVSNVSVYYEPDVDLTATLTDEYGTVMTESSEMYPGAYLINYGLVDKNGEMTTSDLLGKTRYTVTYSLNGEEKTVTSDKNGQVELELKEGDVLDGEITVSYLSGYTITKSSSELGWPAPHPIPPRPAGLLELKVTGGQTTYNLSELGNNPYAVQLVYEGTPLTADQLAAAEVSVFIEGGNAGYALEQTGDGYALNLKYSGTAADTDCGEYTMRVIADYINEFGVTSTSNEVSIPFTIEDDGYDLSLSVDGAGYFVISQLDKSDPIIVVLSADGEPLTDEQLAGTTLTVDAGGLTCTVEPLPGQSAYSVRIVPDDHAQSGKYTLIFKATMLDQIGRTASDEGVKKVELSTYPLWLRFLVIALAILLILLLVIFFLNMKVLPKRIGVNAAQSAFIVDGETVKGTFKCAYSGGGKKKGSLQVAAPPYSGSALIKGGFTLTLQAVSPRRVKSSSRHVLVTRIAPANTGALQSLTIGNHTLVKSDEDDSVTWWFDGQQVPGAAVTTKFDMSGKPTCVFTGSTINGDDFTLKVELQFR